MPCWRKYTIIVTYTNIRDASVTCQQPDKSRNCNGWQRDSLFVPQLVSFCCCLQSLISQFNLMVTLFNCIAVSKTSALFPQQFNMPTLQWPFAQQLQHLQKSSFTLRRRIHRLETHSPQLPQLEEKSSCVQKRSLLRFEIQSPQLSKQVKKSSSVFSQGLFRRLLKFNKLTFDDRAKLLMREASVMLIHPLNTSVVKEWLLRLQPEHKMTL